MTVFLVGGSKSGKSDFAQEVTRRLARGGRHYYVATMIPTEQACDQAVIRSHLRRRAGQGFETIEQGRDLLACLDHADKNAAFLLDAVTTLLSNELFPAEKDYEIDEAAALRCGGELVAFAHAVSNAVIVSDNLFCDAVRYDAATDAFRRHLGAIHCRLAEVCDTVLEMTNGRLTIHKGELPE